MQSNFSHQSTPNVLKHAHTQLTELRRLQGLITADSSGSNLLTLSQFRSPVRGIVLISVLAMHFAGNEQAGGAGGT